MTVYAEEVNYFETSTVAPDTWIEKAKKEITGIGGKVLQSGYGEDSNGRAMFLLAFKIGDDTFNIRWAALPYRTATKVEKMKAQKERACKIQAATLLYHDVKHKVVMAKIKGVRASFLEYLLLPNGKTAGEASADTDTFTALLPNLTLMLGTGS